MIPLSSYRVVRDPIYGYVQLPDRLESLVAAPIVQRLRRIAQTSLTSAVYPSATGTRFEHALGTMHLAGRAWRAAWRNASPRAQSEFERVLTAEVPILGERDDERAPFDEEVEAAVMAVGLLHDLGHPPFSHILEPTYKQRMVGLFARPGADNAALLDRLSTAGAQFHERAGEYLLDQYIVPRADRVLGPLLRAVYHAEPTDVTACAALHSIVSSELDVDRLDYLMRDGQRAGTEFGALDWARLVDSYVLRIYGEATKGQGIGFRIAPSTRARSAAESLLLQRVQAYRWVIYHHRVLGTNLALVLALERLLQLAETESLLDSGRVTFSTAAAFDPCVGNLNYLNPGDNAIDRLHAGPRVPSIRAEAASHLLSAALPPIANDEIHREFLASSVDDSTVVRALLDARVVAVQLEQQAGQPVRRELSMFTSFVDGSLFRQKTFLSLWDTEDDFASVSRVLVDEFAVLDIARGAISQTSPDFDMRFLDGPPARCVNALLKLVLSQAPSRERLASLLSETAGTLRGEWHVTRSRLVAASSGTKSGFLFNPEGHPFVLRRDSALVRAAIQIEQERPDINAFFFFEDRDFLSRVQPGPARATELLRGHFVSIFPEFLRSELPAALSRPDDG